MSSHERGFHDLSEEQLDGLELYYETHRGIHVGWYGPKWLRRIGCWFVGGHRWEYGFPGDDDRYCLQCSKVEA